MGEDIRRLVRNRIQRSDVRDHIQRIVAANKTAVRPLSPQSLRRLLQSDDLVASMKDECLLALQAERQGGCRTSPHTARMLGVPSPTAVSAAATSEMICIQRDRSAFAKPNSATGLIVVVSSGQQFAGHAAWTGVGPGPMFLLSAHFRGQRWAAAPQPCSINPVFNATFTFDMPASAASQPDLLDPIHLVIVRREPDGTADLVCSHLLDGQAMALKQIGQENSDSAVEVFGAGPNASIPAGVLNLRVQLGSMEDATAGQSISAARGLLAIRQSEQRDHEQQFMLYSKTWWHEFLRMHPDHQHRLVEIFLADENGKKHFACSRLSVFPPGRLLDTPREAARFVSLFPHEQLTAVGAEGDGQVPLLKQWSKLFTILCLGKGSVEDHALLLCSLLLGFGMDAYICLGTRRQPDNPHLKPTNHAWVMTREGVTTAVFWESLTGERFVHHHARDVKREGPNGHNYVTLDCIFNNHALYANLQTSNHVDEAHLDLHDSAHWKKIGEPEAKPLMFASRLPPPLWRNRLDPCSAAQALEQELAVLITEVRKEQNQSTTWNDVLAQILAQALAAYETDRTAGVLVGNEEFQHVVRRCTPSGHTFKGYPNNFIHLHAKKILTQCSSDPVFRDILLTQGSAVNHALRVKIYVFPENRLSVWLMLAVTYKSII